MHTYDTAKGHCPSAFSIEGHFNHHGIVYLLSTSIEPGKKIPCHPVLKGTHGSQTHRK